jgi:anti-sigma B factor antagonist
MRISLSRHGGSVKVRLDESLDIQDIQESKDHLLEALSCAGSAIEVDLSGISELDTAGVQLLLLVDRQARRNGLRCTWSNPSGAVTEVLELLHLDLCKSLVIAN